MDLSIFLLRQACFCACCVLLLCKAEDGKEERMKTVLLPVFLFDISYLNYILKNYKWGFRFFERADHYGSAPFKEPPPNRLKFLS